MLAPCVVPKGSPAGGQVGRPKRQHLMTARRTISGAARTAAGAERSGQHFGELDQVTERVGEESELPADSRQDPRLGDDLDAARAKLGERFLHAGNVEAEMVVATIFQAIAEFLIRAHLRRRGVTLA